MKDWYRTMSVQDIAYYRQQDGRDILKVTFKPTKNFPNGVGYVDAYFEDLIKKYSWFIDHYGYIVATVGSRRKGEQKYYRLHQEIAIKCLNYYPEYLDHISGLRLDNIGLNM